MRFFLWLFIPTLIFAGFHDPQILKENLDEIEDASHIEQVLNLIEDEEVHDAYAFLLSFMPSVDLVALDPDKYFSELEKAFETRNEVAWGDEIPKEVWFNYVLPHRVAQEPLEYWREYLYTELKPLIDTCQSATSAAIVINVWCADHVYFKQTQRQDQGVFETLKSGYGRCEEMAIIYVCALRACSIPARQVWTPYWPTGDNNHAWVEVWAEGQWNFTGGCEPRDSLNTGWFANAARTTAVVHTVCYGKPLTDEPVYKERDKYTLIYSTDNYGIETGKLIVSTPSSNEPPDSVNVNVSIYNWGAFRTIMSKVATTGSTEFHLNEGDYYISAGDSTGYWDELVHIQSNQTTEVEVILGPIDMTKRKYDVIFRKAEDN